MANVFDLDPTNTNNNTTSGGSNTNNTFGAAPGGGLQQQGKSGGAPIVGPSDGGLDNPGGLPGGNGGNQKTGKSGGQSAIDLVNGARGGTNTLAVDDRAGNKMVPTNLGGTGDNWLPGWGWHEPYDLFSAAPRPVVGPSAMEEWAMKKVPQLGQSNPHYDAAAQTLGGLQDMASRRITGAGLQDDPAYKAAMSSFESNMLPMIENQAELAGLGRSSTLSNASAAQQAQVALPMVQDYFGREERALDRELGTAGNVFQGQLGLGGIDDQRLQNAIGTGLHVGGIGRGISQDRADAAYNDYIRRAALFENIMGAPFGLTPSTIGATATSTKDKK